MGTRLAALYLDLFERPGQRRVFRHPASVVSCKFAENLRPSGPPRARRATPTLRVGTRPAGGVPVAVFGCNGSWTPGPPSHQNGRTYTAPGATRPERAAAPEQGGPVPGTCANARVQALGGRGAVPRAEGIVRGLPIRYAR
jgi:hypothetical protein